MAAPACLILGQQTGQLHGTIRIVSPCDNSLKSGSCAKPAPSRPVFDLDKPLCLYQSVAGSKTPVQKMVSTIELNRIVGQSIIAQSNHPATIAGTLKGPNGFWLNPYGIEVTNVTADP